MHHKLFPRQVAVLPKTTRNICQSVFSIRIIVSNRSAAEKNSYSAHSIGEKADSK